MFQLLPSVGIITHLEGLFLMHFITPVKTCGCIVVGVEGRYQSVCIGCRYTVVDILGVPEEHPERLSVLLSLTQW